MKVADIIAATTIREVWITLGGDRPTKARAGEVAQ